MKKNVIALCIFCISAGASVNATEFNKGRAGYKVCMDTASGVHPAMIDCIRGEKNFTRLAKLALFDDFSADKSRSRIELFPELKRWNRFGCDM